MKSLVFLLISIMSFSAFAQIAPTEEEIDARVESTRDLICQEVHNGDCSEFTYISKTFNYSKELKDLLNTYADGHSPYAWAVDLKWNVILANVFVEDSGLTKELNYYRKHKLIRAMYAFYPNSSDCSELSDLGEYQGVRGCGIYEVLIYLKDGRGLYFGFDFNGE